MRIPRGARYGVKDFPTNYPTYQYGVLDKNVLSANARNFQRISRGKSWSYTNRLNFSTSFANSGYPDFSYSETFDEVLEFSQTAYSDYLTTTEVSTSADFSLYMPTAQIGRYSGASGESTASISASGASGGFAYDFTVTDYYGITFQSQQCPVFYDVATSFCTEDGVYVPYDKDYLETRSSTSTDQLAHTNFCNIGTGIGTKSTVLQMSSSIIKYTDKLMDIYLLNKADYETILAMGAGDYGLPMLAGLTSPELRSITTGCQYWGILTVKKPCFSKYTINIHAESSSSGALNYLDSATCTCLYRSGPIPDERKLDTDSESTSTGAFGEQHILRTRSLQTGFDLYSTTSDGGYWGWAAPTYTMVLGS